MATGGRRSPSDRRLMAEYMSRNDEDEDTSTDDPWDNQEEYVLDPYLWDFRKSLIQAVRQEFSLHDLSQPFCLDPDFQTEKHRSQRLKIWRRVAKRLNMEKADDRVEICKAEWNNLEESYFKYYEARLKYGKDNVKPFKYAQQMAFFEDDFGYRGRQIKKKYVCTAAQSTARNSTSHSRGDEREVASTSGKRRRLTENDLTNTDPTDSDLTDSELSKDEEEKREEVNEDEDSENIHPNPGRKRTHDEKRERALKRAHQAEARQVASLQGCWNYTNYDRGEFNYDADEGSDDDAFDEEFGEPKWVWDYFIKVILGVKRFRCLNDPNHIFNITPCDSEIALRETWNVVASRAKLWGAANDAKKIWVEMVKNYKKFRESEKEGRAVPFVYAPLMSFMDPYLFPDEPAKRARCASRGSSEPSVEIPPPTEGEAGSSLEEREDEDKLFLLSLHHTLKDLSPREKPRAKIKIREIINKLRSEN